MTPLARILDRIGWSAPQLAGRLGVHHATAYRWLAGKNTRGNPASTPPTVLEWLERIARAIERENPPKV